ncbi:MAG: tRNA threonylcarbamoyladenosine dehydratase [Clostridia bacterium]|nr:tRNA threonylcarbamoyladenosine dehydratase [Clostridia bacterium]
MQFSRTELLIGSENLKKLFNAKVIVFGLGGVGGIVAESLVRTGVGTIGIVDNDTVSESNINRQIIAKTSTVGKPKTELFKKRLESINPKVKVEVYNLFYSKENEIDLSKYDYIVDAIDTVSSKILLIKRAKELGVKIISSMGTAGKLDPTRLEITDIKKTSVCPLARVMRRELKKEGIEDLKVVYSKEERVEIELKEDLLEKKGKAVAPPSMMFVPSTAGLLIASEVVKDLTR